MHTRYAPTLWKPMSGKCYLTSLRLDHAYERFMDDWKTFVGKKPFSTKVMVYGRR
jgi:hypothetical protein